MPLQSVDQSFWTGHDCIGIGQMTVAEASTVRVENVWEMLDSLLETANRLARSPIGRDDYYQQFLTEWVNGWSALGAGIWQLSGSSWIPIAVVGVGADDQASVEFASQGRGNGQHTSIPITRPCVPLADALSACRQSAEWVIWHRSAGHDRVLLLLIPILAVDGVKRVAIVAMSVAPPVDSQAGFLECAAELARTAADYEDRLQLRSHHEKAQWWDRVLRWSDGRGRTAELEEAAYWLVNEACDYIGCDRVSFVTNRRGHHRVVAVSGVSTPDARANETRRLEKLSVGTRRGQAPTWQSGPTGRVVIFPEWSAEPRSTGAAWSLIVEDFGEPDTLNDGIERRAAIVASSSSLLTKQPDREIPLSFGWKLIRAIRPAHQPRWKRWAAVCAVLAAVAFLPIAHDVPAIGTLQPSSRRNVFSPFDGTIHKLHVGHGHEVEAGDLLTVIRQPEIERELSRIVADTQTIRERLAVAQAKRLEHRSNRDVEGSHSRTYAAEEVELQQQLDSLGLQHQTLQRHADELQVRSPIGGQVLTWDVESRLQGRPVERGDKLFTVASLTDGWELILDVSPREVGHLRAAQRAGTRLTVQYTLSTAPTDVREAELTDLSIAFDRDESGEPYARARVPIADDNAVRLQPGVTVRARIHCGSRALGFVWFHEAWESARSALFF